MALTFQNLPIYLVTRMNKLKEIKTNLSSPKIFYRPLEVLLLNNNTT